MKTSILLVALLVLSTPFVPTAAAASAPAAEESATCAPGPIGLACRIVLSIVCIFYPRICYVTQ